MNTSEQNTSTRQTAINGLAVTGFVAIIAFGIWLAAYSARFVPNVVGNLSVAAVSLSQIFTPAKAPALSVVTSTTSPTIAFGNATTTATTTAPKKTVSMDTSAVKTPGQKTTTTYTLGGTATDTGALYGFPDLIVSIESGGYLNASTTDSFVASSTVPSGKIPAVKFVIKNVGTNATGAWRFSASIPTQTAYIYQSVPQQSLNPGDRIEYILGFDQANKGANETISITANFDHTVVESNTNNNSASTALTILGS
ncbi:MAG: CARDB domain-containing protein [Minisyncoccia bacterium]